MKIVHLFFIVLMALTFQTEVAGWTIQSQSCSSHSECEELASGIPKPVASYCVLDAQKDGRCFSDVDFSSYSVVDYNWRDTMDT